MRRRMKTFLMTTALIATTALSAQAFNAGAVGPVSLQNGFPVWWQDDAGVRVDLCTTAACLGTPVIPGNPMSQQVGFGPEAFWWMTLGDNGSVSLELAMEAAWAAEIPAPGQQGPFARVRLLGAVSAPGTWTVAGSGFNFTAEAVDVGNGPEFKNQGVDFPGAATDIPPFSAIVAPGASQITQFYGVGTNPAPPADITITGPGLAQTITPAQFVLQTGRLFDSGNNIPPIANSDIAGTLVATPVTINLSANDVDPISPTNVHGINPKAVGLGSALPFVFEPGDPALSTTPGMATARGGRVAKNADGTVTYRPAAAFSGVDSFSYVIQDTGGCISGQATTLDPPVTGTNNICLPLAPAAPVASALAIITVEQATAQATFRPKVQKWEISGASSIADLKATDAAGSPVLFTKLVGAQEVPPQVSPGSGEVSVTLQAGVDTLLGTADDLINYSLTYTGLTGVTQSHIHSGALGVNGPPHVFLCSNTLGGTTPACPAAGGTVTGTLVAANFTASVAVPDFPALIAAIQAGTTYVNVHTTAVPAGEIRGQIGRNVVAVHSGPTTAAPLLGVAAIPPLTTQTSAWALPAKLDGVPSSDRTITIQTSAGSTVTVPLKLK